VTARILPNHKNKESIEIIAFPAVAVNMEEKNVAGR